MSLLDEEVPGVKIPKPTEADKERFRGLVPDDPRVEVKPMFGNIAAFVNGNMFMGLFGPQVGLKLPAATRDEVAALDGAGPFGPEERPMGGYVALPPAYLDDAAQVEPLAFAALEHVAALPPKKPKAKAKK